MPLQIRALGNNKLFVGKSGHGSSLTFEPPLLIAYLCPPGSSVGAGGVGAIAIIHRAPPSPHETSTAHHYLVSLQDPAKGWGMGGGGLISAGC